MGRKRPEVVDALGQRILEIAHCDLADIRKGGARVRAGKHVQMSHDDLSLEPSSGFAS